MCPQKRARFFTFEFAIEAAIMEQQALDTAAASLSSSEVVSAVNNASLSRTGQGRSSGTAVRVRCGNCELRNHHPLQRSARGQLCNNCGKYK